jgi:ketosteroid isomerase-like protein
MSQENVGVLRGTRIALPPLSESAIQRRTLDERLLVRVPVLYRLLAAVLWRLGRLSRPRRLIVGYSIQRGYAALNRRDYEVVLMRSDPDVEYRPSGSVMPPDLEAVFYGHDGYRKLWRRWFDAFEDLRWDPEESLDFGDRLLVTASLRGHGSGSGVAVSEPVFQLFKIRRGLSISQEDFTDRDQALEAAGLNPDVPRHS